MRHNLFPTLTALTRRLEPGQGTEGSDESQSVKYLWINALCIDQENVSERNHQVQFMRTISSQAKCVVVWLGDQCETALDCLNPSQIPTDEHKYQESDSSGYFHEQEANNILHSCHDAKYWPRL